MSSTESNISGGGVRETLISNDDTYIEPAIEKENRRNSVGTQVSIGSQQNSNMCMKQMPKNQMVFFAQVFLIYGLIAVSLSQLILQSNEKELWLVLLASSVGYILPSPRLKYLKLSSPLPTITTTYESFPSAATDAVDSTDDRSTFPSAV